MSELRELNIIRLADLVRKHHAEAQAAWTLGLGHAHKCGLALLELKARHKSGLSKHGNWQKWLARTFPAVRYPTLARYMFIAKNWSRPAVVEARQNGLLTSIESFVQVVKSSKEPTNRKHLSQQERQEYDKARRHLCSEFRKNLLDLTPDEIQLLDERFDDFWFDWHQEIEQAAKRQRLKVTV
jgi:hypothetical protein